MRIWLLAGTLLALVPASPAAATSLRDGLRQAALVVHGRVGSVASYDEGRYQVAQIDVAKTLKGKMATKSLQVADRNDLPASPDLFQPGDYVVLLLAPARRTSSLRKHLPPGPYYEVVHRRDGAICGADARNLQEAADIVARWLDLAGSVASAPNPGDRLRPLVFDEIRARHPSIVADGLRNLGTLAGLGETLTAREAEVLAGVLGRTDLPEWLRLAAVQAVTQAKLKATLPALRSMPATTPKIQQAVWTALPELGATLREEDLAPALSSDEPGLRIAATNALVRGIGVTTLPRISEIALRDPDTSVRRAAILAVGEARWNEALPLLERTFVSPESTIRQASAQAIHAIGGVRAQESLARLAFQGPADAQKYAVILLMTSGVGEEDPVLRRIRDSHPDESVRHLVEEGLEVHDH